MLQQKVVEMDAIRHRGSRVLGWAVHRSVGLGCQEFCCRTEETAGCEPWRPKFCDEDLRDITYFRITLVSLMDLLLVTSPAILSDLVTL